jgi:hypothetical protein
VDALILDRYAFKLSLLLDECIPPGISGKSFALKCGLLLLITGLLEVETADATIALALFFPESDLLLTLTERIPKSGLFDDPAACGREG